MTWIGEFADHLSKEEAYKTTKSGLKYLKLPSTQKQSFIKKGDHVTVLYKLYLDPSHQFIYSQATQEEAFSLTVGKGQVIKGFDEALLLMRYGEKGRFLLPASIAYGTGGQSGFGIPGGATLEYYLEVMAPTATKVDL